MALSPGAFSSAVSAFLVDSRVLRRAALQVGWRVERLGDWEVPERLLPRRLIFSGEFGYLQVIAHKLSWALLNAPPDWLLHLSWNYRQRSIEKKTLAAARKLAHPTFVKHATGKVDRLHKKQRAPSGVVFVSWLPSLWFLPVLHCAGLAEVDTYTGSFHDDEIELAQLLLVTAITFVDHTVTLLKSMLFPHMERANMFLIKDGWLKAHMTRTCPYHGA